MILRIKKGVIYVLEEGLDDRAIGCIFDSATEDDERLIECGSETVKAVEEFVKKVNTGSFKPRSVVREFEKILEKYAIG